MLFERIKVLAKYAYFKNKQFKDKEDLRSWQKKHLSQHLEFAANNFPFFESYKGQPLELWPQIDKDTFLNSYSKLNRLGLSIEDARSFGENAESTRDFLKKHNGYTLGVSSGTTGQRMPFIVSDKERVMWAGAILAKILRTSIFKKNKVAFIFRADSNLYQTVNSKSLQLRFYDLKQGFKDIVSKLNEYNCDILIAPAQVLKLLAYSKLNGELKVEPKQVVSVAEVFDQQTKSIVKNSFQCSVDEVYQATEGFLGATCARGTMHLNEDFFIVEKRFIDYQRFIPVITDTFRQSQAIIRYRLNDVLQIRSTPCECGSMLTPIEKIEGRTDDILLIPGKTRKTEIIPIFPDFIRDKIASLTSVYRFQIEQKKADKLLVHFDGVVGTSEQRKLTDSIHAVCDSFDTIKPEINFNLNAEFDPLSKDRRVYRSFKTLPEDYQCQAEYL